MGGLRTTSAVTGTQEGRSKAAAQARRKRWQETRQTGRQRAHELHRFGSREAGKDQSQVGAESRERRPTGGRWRNIFRNCGVEVQKLWLDPAEPRRIVAKESQGGHGQYDRRVE